MRLLLLIFAFALFLGGGVAASCPRTSTLTLAAQRMTAGDGVVTATVYAGHYRSVLPLRVQWGSLPPGPVYGTIILPPNHTLIRDDVPVGWFDGQAAMTLEQLTLMSRDQALMWHVSSSAMVAGAAGGILYLGPNSPVWQAHDAVSFSGSQLHFHERRLGRQCTAVGALAETSGEKTLLFGTPLRHRLGVYDTASGTLLTEWHVVVQFDPDAGQTLVPAEALTILGEDHEMDRRLVLDGAILIARTSDIRPALLVAPEGPSFGATLMKQAGRPNPNKKRADEDGEDVLRIVFGRRVLQKVALGWAVDSAGHAAAQFVVDSSSSSAVGNASLASGTTSVPLGVYWVTFLAGSVLAILAAYWTGHLALSIRLRYAPSPSPSHPLHGDKEGSGSVVTRRDLVSGYGVLGLSVLTHVLLLCFGGHDPLIDDALRRPLNTFVTIFASESLAVGIAFLAVLAFETCREMQWVAGTRAFRVIPVQLYAILQGAVISRGVLAALLVGAGTSLPQLAVTNLAMLVFVFFPSVHGFMMLLIHAISGLYLFMPGAKPGSEEPRGRIAGLLVWLAVLLMLGLAVGVGVSQPMFLLWPFFDALNSYYPAELVRGAVWAGMAVPLYMASFSIGKGARTILENARKKAV